MAFRPEIWINAFVQFFRAQPALLDRITRYDSFVGTATRGQTIHIPSLSLPASADIVPGSVGSAGLQTATETMVDLILDKMKGHAIPITTLDERFNHPDYINALMSEAARRIKNATTQDVLALAVDAGVTQEVNADGGALADSDILAIEKFLAEAECPTEGRLLVVTPNGANDLKAITTYTSRDFGEGQGQREVRYVRSFELLEVPTAYFETVTTNAACMALHASAIAGAVAQPHMKLLDQAGEFRAILETAAIYGLKLQKADRIVRVLRAV